MTTDTFRIEAGLIARNQAHAAASRAPDSGFSNLLEQAARSLSQEERPNDAGMRIRENAADSVANQERITQARQQEERMTQARQQDERTRQPDKDRESASRDGSQKTEKTTSEHKKADRNPGTEARDNPGSVQDRKAADLKRLLKQIQDSKAGTKMPASSTPSTAAPDEALANQASSASGRSQARLMPEQSDAAADTRETHLPAGDAAQAAQHPETAVKAGAAPAGETLQGTVRRFERPISEQAQAGATGLQGALAGSSPLETPQGGRMGQSMAASAQSGATGRAASMAHSQGLQSSQGPQGSDLTMAFGAALQRTQEALPGFESTHALLAPSSGHEKAAMIESTGAGAAPASLAAGALGSGLSQAAGLNTPSAPGVQPGAVQWSLPYAPGEARFGEALGERLNWMIRDGLQQAEIILNPRELGPIRIALSMEGDAAQLGIQADHAFTRQTIEDALPRLKALLAEQGVQLGQTQIDQGSGREPGAGQHDAARHARSTGREMSSEMGSAAGREGEVQTGQVSLRSPGRGRIDVFA